ncbi:MAG: carbon-nitrogen hydrolase family protein [Deltaproteobacteria bacterium]|jgi:predicted amidohydrolase|nr:carbon-nitrogen hydrolase family protein [Deltaproteobacteria bacterium]
MTKSPVLKVALVHLEVLGGQLTANLENFLKLAREAARNGAQLIVGPEMAMSGYCFESRESMAPFAQTEDGPVLKAVKELAAELEVHVVIGLAERDEPGGMFYNSAFLVSSQGRIAGRARKINAESRWACPASQLQNNIWSTPWGQVGIHICADSWNSLITRVTAVKGADMLILPANWPPSGINPQDLWRFRALENGLWFVGCNRTGIEKKFDCTEAVSCAYDPKGREIFSGQSPVSTVFYLEIPLTAEGRLDSSRRKEIMARRTPQKYHRLYGNFSGLKDLTGFLKLPAPGPMEIRALVPEAGRNPVDFVENAIGDLPEESLLVLPQAPLDSASLERLKNMLGRRFLVSRLGPRRSDFLVLGGDGPGISLPSEGLCLADIHKGRFWLADEDEIVQPEAAVAAAKSGADAAVAFVSSLTPEMKLLAAMRPIDQLAAILTAPDGAAMGLMYLGHQTGRGAAVSPGQAGGLTLDTAETREKRFQDRLDFEALFKPGDL